MSARPLGLDAQQYAPLPASFGKYRVTRVLGEGAMGVVYEALDPDIHRNVAIKAIRSALLAPEARDLDGENRFRNEAQAAGRLSHPNIVSVYEYAQTGPQRYIAMEYVAGVSLHETVVHGFRLPLADTLSVIVQLLDALECAHAQGVWHRDIKPANLLLTAEGRLKVTDFGIARIDGSGCTHHTTVLGSPGYMAPERYTDEAPDARVDIFSCGVLLYELLAGSAPFRGSAGAVMYQVLHDEPPPPSTLPLEPPAPAAFDAVAARAMAKRPAERFADAAQMRAALLAAAAMPVAPRVSADTMRRLRHARSDAPTQAMPRPLAVMPRGATPPRSALPVLGTTPMQPGLVERAARVLAEQIGPIAPLLARRAAAKAATREVFFATLAQALTRDAERRVLLDKLWALR